MKSIMQTAFAITMAAFALTAHAAQVEITGYRSGGCVLPDGVRAQPRFGEISPARFGNGQQEACKSHVDTAIATCKQNTRFASDAMNAQYPGCFPRFEENARDCVLAYEGEKAKCDGLTTAKQEADAQAADSGEREAAAAAPGAQAADSGAENGEREAAAAAPGAQAADSGGFIDITPEDESECMEAGPPDENGWAEVNVPCDEAARQRREAAERQAERQRREAAEARAAEAEAEAERQRREAAEARAAEAEAERQRREAAAGPPQPDHVLDAEAVALTEWYDAKADARDSAARLDEAIANAAAAEHGYSRAAMRDAESAAYTLSLALDESIDVSLEQLRNAAQYGQTTARALDRSVANLVNRAGRRPAERAHSANTRAAQERAVAERERREAARERREAALEAEAERESAARQAAFDRAVTNFNNTMGVALQQQRAAERAAAEAATESVGSTGSTGGDWECVPHINNCNCSSSCPK